MGGMSRKKKYREKRRRRKQHLAGQGYYQGRAPGTNRPPLGTGRTYVARDALLRCLGFSSYAEYLASDLWAGVRARAFRQHGRTCVLCEWPAEIVHHLAYTKGVLTGTNLDGLSPLCRKCHEEVELNEDGSKRTMREATARYAAHWHILPPRKRVAAIATGHPPYGCCVSCGEETIKGRYWCKECRAGRAAHPAHQ